MALWKQQLLDKYYRLHFYSSSIAYILDLDNNGLLLRIKHLLNFTEMRIFTAISTAVEISLFIATARAVGQYAQ